jgi:hypothetical protein
MEVETMEIKEIRKFARRAIARREAKRLVGKHGPPAPLSSSDETTVQVATVRETRRS